MQPVRCDCALQQGRAWGGAERAGRPVRGCMPADWTRLLPRRCQARQCGADRSATESSHMYMACGCLHLVTCNCICMECTWKIDVNISPIISMLLAQCPVLYNHSGLRASQETTVGCSSLILASHTCDQRMAAGAAIGTSGVAGST